MFFHSTPRYGYRKNKAVKTLCGAVLGLALATSANSAVAANSGDTTTAETPATVATSTDAATTANQLSPAESLKDTANIASPALTDTERLTATGTASTETSPQADLAGGNVATDSQTATTVNQTVTSSITTAATDSQLATSTTTAATDSQAATSTTTTAATNSQLATSTTTAATVNPTSTSTTSTTQTTHAAATASLAHSSTEVTSLTQADKPSAALDTATSATTTTTSLSASASTNHLHSQTLASKAGVQLSDDTDKVQSPAMAQSLKKAEELVEDKPEKAATNATTRATSIKPTTYVAPATEVKQNGRFLAIQRHAAIPSLTEVFYAVWTENKGQNDLKFHQADQKGFLSLDLSKDHQEYGRYHIHTYYKNSRTGNFKFQHALQTEVKTPKVDVKVSKVADGQYAVTVSGLSNDIESLSVPTWSEHQGQDDLIWKQAIKSGVTKYTTKLNIADHQFDTGRYHIHVYGKSKITQQDIGLLATTTTVEDRKITSTITTKSPGIFTVTLDQVPTYFDQVVLPVWSDQDGQDDIVWHKTSKQGQTRYTAEVKIADHQFDTGKYHVHAYGITTTGKMIGLRATTYEVAQPRIVTSVTPKTKDSFTVTVDQVPEYFTGLYAPTWTSHKGQDDIVWHSAKKAGKTTYTADIKIEDHKYETGNYVVHFYGIGPKGKLHGLGGLSHQVAGLATKAVTTVTDVNSKAGTFAVNILETSDSKAIQSIQLEVWSDQDKGNLHTYQLKPTTDKSRIQVNATNHGYKGGTYQTRATIIYKDGSQTVIQPNSSSLPPAQLAPVYDKPSLTATIANNDTVKGTFDVILSNILAPKGIKALHVPIWGEKDGQNDLIWYQATKQADNTYKVSVDAKNHHKRELGTYHAHVYITEGNGIQSLVAVKQHTVDFKQSKLNHIIYLDPGHGGYDSGAISPDGRVYEKHLNLEVAYRVKNKLENQGYQVLMTRYDDRYVDFVTERSRMANYSIADLFVSIHFNAKGLSPYYVSGIETYWYGYDPAYQPIINPVMHNNPDRLTKSESLAHLIQNNLIKHTGAINRGVKRESFTVLRETGIPAVLLELGYIDSYHDLAKITTAAYQEKLSQAIVEGLLTYYSIFD